MIRTKLAVIGLGKRGFYWVKHVLLGLENVEVTAVCDSYFDRAEEVSQLVASKYGTPPAVVTADYMEVLASKEVDAVLITSSWESHIPIAIQAMKAGKAVALEVAGAYTIESCFDLVKAYEQTKTPFMFLENCCFGRKELMALNMVRKGLFGEIVHCTGGYMHDLRKEIAFGKENRHYRLRNYLNRNCENYPTHELGPIAKLLDINNGNRMVSLVSVSSKSAGLKEYINTTEGVDPELKTVNVLQGDIVTTIIKCALGQTITLTLDTTLPRYYSRDFSVRGTKGMYEERTDSVYLDECDRDKEVNWKPYFLNAEQYLEKYEHPIWQRYLEQGVKGGHDGMDYLVISAFLEALQQGLPMPIDVYDAASWMAVTVLSEQSIALGGTPVAFPDFTGGYWNGNRRTNQGKYSL